MPADFKWPGSQRLVLLDSKFIFILSVKESRNGYELDLIWDLCTNNLSFHYHNWRDTCLSEEWGLPFFVSFE
ncbi:MAG: hypothetical protein CMD54_00730 [Gammaproteobacteria bacterium]|nr:hypothetical protein [Gammaproteobacteria bacterium]